MPEVTVWPMPKGLPMATTKSPTFMASESPNLSSAKSCASIFSTAMSVPGSVPTSCALNVRRSFSVTTICWALSMT